MKIDKCQGGSLCYRPRELSELDEALRLVAQDKTAGIQSTILPAENSWLEVHWDWAKELCGILPDDLPF